MMSHGTRNLLSLKIRHYAARMIDLNEYLAAFPGAKASDFCCVTELDEILLKSMSTIWIKQVYVQRFDCGSIDLKQL